MQTGRQTACWKMTGTGLVGKTGESEYRIFPYRKSCEAEIDAGCAAGTCGKGSENIL